MFTTATATVDRKIGNQGFGFIRAMHEGVEIQIFVREERLIEAGLKTIDFKEGDRVSLDYEKGQDGRFRAIRIHSVQGVNAKIVSTPHVTIDQFLDPNKVVENLVTGEVLWRIENSEKEIIQYIVTDLVGKVLRQLGRVTSNDGRLNIGLEMKAPKVQVIRRRRVQPEMMAAE